MSRRITAAISEVAVLPPEAIWVVFEDVAAEDLVRRRHHSGRAQESRQAMTLEIRDPRFTDLVDHAIECEKVASGFGFSEGPLWNAQEQCLLFSGILCNRIHRWSAGADVTIFREPSHMANGLAADRQGD